MPSWWVHRTARADDPQLTCRIPGGRNPYRRMVLDSRLRIPLPRNLFKQEDPAKTIIVTATGVSAARVRALEALGAQVWCLPLREAVRWRGWPCSENSPGIGNRQRDDRRRRDRRRFGA